jgi:hypothetical protein
MSIDGDEKAGEKFLEKISEKFWAFAIAKETCDCRCERFALSEKVQEKFW